MSIASKARSLGELLDELVTQTGTLFRKEMELARTEMSAKVQHASSGIAVVVAGALSLTAAMVILLQAVVAFLAPSLGEAGAGFLVGGLVAVVAAIVIRNGANRTKNTKLAPERTGRQLKEDVELIKEQR